ncbi:hypothetical protein ACFCZ6_13920 [Streptomyces hydrogenans]|uniref:hypothetical protein n=1 Tax=Streptomyces hydrogenans TaxID=1873719 RepID=UPI0035E0FE59
MNYFGIAYVTEGDLEAAAAFRKKEEEQPGAFVDLLFTVPAHGPTAMLNPRAQEAVGATLTLHLSGAADQDRLLPVLRAVGRVHSEGAGPMLPVGTVMLGGEIAARYLYQQLSRRYPPFLLAPLKTAISLLWPLPGRGRPEGRPNPAMALLRLANGEYRTLFTHTEIQAMRLIARALAGGSLAVRLQCAAGVCATFARGRVRFDRDVLTVVREDVLTARTAALPAPALETL